MKKVKKQGKKKEEKSMRLVITQKNTNKVCLKKEVSVDQTSGVSQLVGNTCKGSFALEDHGNRVSGTALK